MSLSFHLFSCPALFRKEPRGFRHAHPEVQGEGLKCPPQRRLGPRGLALQPWFCLQPGVQTSPSTSLCPVCLECPVGVTAMPGPPPGSFEGQRVSRSLLVCRTNLASGGQCVQRAVCSAPPPLSRSSLSTTVRRVALEQQRAGGCPGSRARGCQLSPRTHGRALLSPTADAPQKVTGARDFSSQRHAA